METTPEATEFLRNLLTTGPTLVVKLFFVVGLLMYGFFAIAIVKQVAIMTESVEDEVNRIVRLLSYVHLLLTVLVLVAALIWL